MQSSYDPSKPDRCEAIFSPQPSDEALARPRRLLFLAPFAPRLDAPHGGARVLAQFLFALATHHRIGLVHLRDLDEPPIDPDLRQHCEVVEEVFRTAGRRGLFRRVSYRARVTLAPFWGVPQWAAHCRVAAFGRLAAEVARQWRPHLIQAEYHVMGQYLLELESLGIPRILNIYEPGAEAALDRWRTGHQPLRGILDWQAWRRFEGRVLRRVDAVVVFTDRDRRALARPGIPTPIHRIPLGAMLPPAPMSPTGHGPSMALFVGSFGHPPNVDAAERLVDAIFPRVRQALPGATLRLVGGAPPQRLLRRAGPGVVFTGLVPNVAPYLDQAAIVVAPLRLGGGMRVKVLEALAAGKALVASPLAVEGLDLRDRLHLVVAEGDAEFAAAMVELLADAATRSALAERARAWALAHLDWRRIIPSYNGLYDSLLSP